MAAVGAERIVVNGASRTDAGVHALGQVASSIVATRLDDKTLVRAMNARLPDAIAILSVKTVEDTFHARFSAVGKRYIYQYECSPRQAPAERAYRAWTHDELDITEMRAGASLLIGRQDFASFANVGSPRATTVRTIRSVHIFKRKTKVYFCFEGDGFLYNQVRSMTGTLCHVGRGKIKAAEIANILQARDRRAAGPTAPAHGLFLVRVLYGTGTSFPAATAEEDTPEG